MNPSIVCHITLPITDLFLKALSVYCLLRYPLSTMRLGQHFYPGGGVLPYKRLMGMSRWMGSLLHDWIDCNWVAFSIELLEWDRTFSDCLG